jgi:spermidine synthase
VIQKRSILYALFFFSGIAGLVYEILWMRYFNLLFGNTAKAAAMVLVVFFLGMAIGSLWGGRLAHRVRNPLTLYGWVEMSIALTAAPIPLLLPLYEHLYAPIFLNLETYSLPFLLDSVRFLMALGITLPAGIFLGATFPIMGAVIVKNPSQLGRDPGMLYGLNTLGGVCGVILTGFFLPALWGITRTYSLAVIINFAVAGFVLLCIRLNAGPSDAIKFDQDTPQAQRTGKKKGQDASLLPDWLLLGIAFGSGVGTIALEVLWTRIFSLVFHNSVYSFSAIVLLALAGFSLGALLVSAFAKYTSNPAGLLGLTLGLTGLLILLTPFIFFQMTGLAYFAYGVGWPWYLFKVIFLVALVILIPVLCAGATLPIVWRLFGILRPIGITLGIVNVWNLAGAIFGALCAGFLMIPVIGLWKSILVISVLFFILSQVTLLYVSKRWAKGFASMAVLAALTLLLFGIHHLTYSVQRLKEGERLLYLDEGKEAVISVVEDGSGVRWLKSNNNYSLGATVAVRGEKRLGHLPLLLHPSPKEVAFIGIGTGISMSAVLDHPVDHLVGMEILPGVLDAIPYFSTHNRNLLTNERVDVVVGDGRVYLKTTDRRFDVIISDLFIPWHAGTGSLYTLEHFEASRERLNRGGIYCQWLPLYQMSGWELGSIAATFAKAFPYVSIWRGDFSTTVPIIGLVGSLEPIALDPEELDRRLESLQERMGPKDPLLRKFADFTLLYAGDLGVIRKWLERFPVNTNDHPVIEFQAPISQSRKLTFIGQPLSVFFHQFQEGSSPNHVILVRLTGRENETPLSPVAGNLLFQAVEAGVEQDLESQLATIKEAVQLLPGSDYLNVLNLVVSSTDTKASRGIVLDELK